MSQAKAKARANEKLVSTAATSDALREAYDVAIKAAKQVGIANVKPFDAPKWGGEMSKQEGTTKAEFFLDGKPGHESMTIKLTLIIAATSHTLGEVTLSHHALQAVKIQHSLQALGLWG